jgi:hypothetical protein
VTVKKTVTTVDNFRRALAQLEDEWRLGEHVARAGLGIADDEALSHARLQVSEPTPAPPRGRGERVAVDVLTLWNQPPFGTDDAPLAAVRRRIAEWPGVEAVGEPVVDTRLGLVWCVVVILRLSQ